MNPDFASFFLGILFTALCALIPYNRSTQQLKAEAARLAKLSVLITRVLEDAGMGKFNRNKAGEPTGLRYTDCVSESATVSGTISTLEVDIHGSYGVGANKKPRA